MRFRSTILAVLVVLLIESGSTAQSSKQPKVQPGPDEPDWVLILKDRFDLRMFEDLLNPVSTTREATIGLFRKAGPGPVKVTPVIALGLEVKIEGGWYPAGAPVPTQGRPLWSYRFKNTTKDLETETNLPPPLLEGSKLEFDPGDEPFGLYLTNAQFHDFVFSEPRRVRSENPRLAKQPYKIMIYPFKEKATGKLVPKSFLIGWEYSTNDDFQDVVTRIDNVELVPPPK